MRSIKFFKRSIEYVWIKLAFLYFLIFFKRIFFFLYVFESILWANLFQTVFIFRCFCSIKRLTAAQFRTSLGHYLPLLIGFPHFSSLSFSIIIWSVKICVTFCRVWNFFAPFDQIWSRVVRSDCLVKFPSNFFGYLQTVDLFWFLQIFWSIMRLHILLRNFNTWQAWLVILVVNVVHFSILLNYFGYM